MTECKLIFRMEAETCSSTVLRRDTADKTLQLKTERGGHRSEGRWGEVVEKNRRGKKAVSCCSSSNTECVCEKFG